ncbi:hypothetical protein CCAX7_10380 [Capsulimonas corticalis]|uniref:Uncharacterized protein n=1 Tax=Capsulimonas corticalis TaxID=2219043 RepID=A0A402CUJ8_9BACT|nr:DUF4085 family protein [Capsulimonas corticalis]BDI28987.1 hypothetical protein CCAX7_10380 [Capsulimonas corticalis]
MKFFTRDLYQWLQDSQPEFEPSENLTAEDAEAAWEEACVASGRTAAVEAWKAASIALRTHFEEIKPRLSDDALNLALTTFHDGIVKNVHFDGKTLQILLDTRGGVCEPIGDVTLTFHGVQSVVGLDAMLDEWWLYEEMDLHPEAAFEYRALLLNAEFSVAADRVEIQHVPQPHASCRRTDS